ncbi:hypothetical protein Lgee_0273 [Legionella geestiana]|uniref:Uncharacterized protein n=1 Tax=Legionella geestiana TaxID=45065 RepID=A0A0W0U8C5_9GAMM|nr:hypothetical protein [Legionella geestiana]KTD04243.1 hypothetical protein Lgee_0273 [Legionella geestiana]QBS11663.1 hypothetical protein E4T54_02295 [Legionella geestiana]QDQ40726.1 hypothetical protein E3226_010125 [Legionella geestiana]STX53652.1 Uncharacterised protein [Legionella geestiana]
MFFKRIAACVAGAVLACSTIEAFAATTLLPTFGALLTALENGESVRAVMRPGRCTLESGNGGVVAFSSAMDYDVYTHYMLPSDDGQSAKEVIATSKTVFSISTIQNLGAITNYVRLHVFRDNTAKLFISILDPVTYQEKLNGTFLCTLTDAEKTGGVTLLQRTR